jgi:hypothetical protein
MSRDMNQTANDCPDCGEELRVNDDPDHAPAAIYSGYNVNFEADPDDANWAACGGCSERFGVEGDTYVVVTPEYTDHPEAGDIRKTRLVATGPVVAGHYANGNMIEQDDPEFRLVSANVRGASLPTGWLDRFHYLPDGSEWEQIRAGWHSSLEKSDVSDRINALTSGDVGIYGPVLVKFGQTRNVCSTSLTVWAPEGLEYWSQEHHERRPFSEYLDGAKSTPAGSF